MGAIQSVFNVHKRSRSTGEARDHESLKAVGVQPVSTAAVTWARPGDIVTNFPLRGGQSSQKESICLKGYLETFVLKGEDKHGIMDYRFCVACGYMAWHVKDPRLNGIHLEFGVGASRCTKEEEDKATAVFAVQKNEQCLICFDNIGEKNETKKRRFGLLSDCNHRFCFECIFKWLDDRLDTEKEKERICPYCRTTTAFIMENDYWIENPQEKLRTVTYREMLRRCLCANSCTECQMNIPPEVDLTEVLD